jgi:hypothetical protein
MRLRRRRKRRGAIFAWMLAMLMVLMAMVAISFDGGRLMDQRRRAQAIADASALAGANELYAEYWDYYGKDFKGTAAAKAKAMAAANGLDPNDVLVDVPPRTGPYAGKPGYIEVNLKIPMEGSFSKAITKQPLSAASRAVAKGMPNPIGIVLLRSNGADAFLNKGLAFTLINAPLIVNSSDSSAYTQQSFGVVVASRFDVVGNYTNPGGALFLGRMRTDVRPVADPLASLPVPEFSKSPIRSSKPLAINSVLPLILEPGVYQGGIRIKGLSIVTMLPGTYVMEGGGFVVEDLSTVVGLETFVYNTEGAYPGGNISIQSLGKIVMTAPLSGTYQGINFFQKRSMTQTVTMRGKGLSAITGTVYAKTAPISLSGLAAVGLDILGGAYVADSMTVDGVGAVNIDLKLNPPRIPDVRLVD